MKDEFAPYHEEVQRALEALGRPGSGEAIARDRGSSLQYLGVSAPGVRQMVKRGFSFYGLPREQVLEIWDTLWRQSPYGEVLFAAVEYYLPIARKQAGPDLWPVVQGWTERVDNWAHADSLSGLYSQILEQRPDEVYPRIVTWNAADSEWLRRISLVSLIHYTGKNAVFLPTASVLPLVSNCLADERYYVQKAVGWVLREMGRVYPGEVKAYIEAHVKSISAVAFSRATERLSPPEVAVLRRLRKDSSPSAGPASSGNAHTEMTAGPGAVESSIREPGDGGVS